MPEPSCCRRKRPTSVAVGGAFMLLLLVELWFLYLNWTVELVVRHDGPSSKISRTAKEQQAEAALISVARTSRESPPKTQHPPPLFYVLQRKFPLHVQPEEMVEVEHAGLAALLASTTALPRTQVLKIEKLLSQNVSKTMMVPRFFDETHGHYYGGSIREYLGGGRRLPTPEQARSIGSRDKSGRETIFVAITSYRDAQCHTTLEDLLERAKYPERIRAAIVDQLAEGDVPCNAPTVPCSERPEQSLCRFAHLIDYYSLESRLAVGQTLARHILHRYYRGEYFVLLIDSHMRFVQDWDDDLIAQWKAAQNEMAVISTYPSDVTPNSIDPVTHRSNVRTTTLMCDSNFVGDGADAIMKHGQQPEGKPTVHGQPVLHPFWAGGFGFSRGHFVIQVPYDAYLPMVFHGDEISIGIRAFTYGYDLYAPERGVVFHMYQKGGVQFPHFYENLHLYSGVLEASHKRLNAIVGLSHHDSREWRTTEVDKYGVGRIRTAAKFFLTFGIHPETKSVEKNLCSFVGAPMMKTFGPVLRPDGMGLDYSKIDFAFRDPVSKRPSEAFGV